jgi:hypothetical protein
LFEVEEPFDDMGKARKTRKFAATKRIINTTKDTRLKSVKSKLNASTKSNPPKDTELVREMSPLLLFPLY